MRKIEYIISFSSKKGKRPTNEDSHKIYSKINSKSNFKWLDILPNILCIFDGHGGKDISEYLSKIYYLEILRNLNEIRNIYRKYKILKKDFEKNNENEKMNIELTDFFTIIHDKINMNILKKYEKKSFEQGSTLCCLIHDNESLTNKNKLIFINVGDSRCVMFNQIKVEEGIDILDSGNKFTMKQITFDHKPKYKIEKERIENLGGKIEIDVENEKRICGYSVSRSFGDVLYSRYISVKPQVRCMDLTEDMKFFVIACDGLWDVLTNGDVKKIIVKRCYDKEGKLIKNNAENIADFLTNHAIIKGSYDNVSVIVYFVNY